MQIGKYICTKKIICLFDLPYIMQPVDSVCHRSASYSMLSYFFDV